MTTLEFAEPDGIAARGTLIVVPGRGERPAVYQRLGARISADAYRVSVVPDPTSDAVATLTEINALLSREGLARPALLVGSDTGALFAAAALARGEVNGIDGLILVGLPGPDSASQTGSWDDELEARTTCPTHRGRISGKIVSRGALYQPIPADWHDRADLSAVGVPVLAIHGQQDPISPLADVQDRYSAAEQIELVSVAGARHDALNDQTHRSVAATVILWLERLKRDADQLSPIITAEQLEDRVA